MAQEDTIFALSSGSPPSAIAVMRISGLQAFDAVKTLAGRLPEARRATLARLTDPIDGGLLDEALLLIFPGPHSATGEDLAELHLHGGRAVVRAVENALGKMGGFRAAQPGEFTRRAFANGRIDLNEAEGLSDLLSAETEWQRRSAADMMSGRFSALVEDWRLEILRLSALIEAALDFSDEDDVSSQENSQTTNRYDGIVEQMQQILALPPAEKLRDGLRIVLGGPPNSGKSTLLNALVAREAAIVSDIAGTTRDIIEIPVALAGIPLVFADTAGLQDDTADRIEAEGIDRARSAMAKADILLWLGPQGAGPEHPQILEIAPKADHPGHREKGDGSISLSAHSGAGMDALREEIVRRARTLLPPVDSYAVNSRQSGEIDKALRALEAAREERDLLIAAEHLRQARLALDALTGRASTEDMLDGLFGRFCIGK